ncbi:MAG: DNA-binding protein [Clostridia bacterium]|nr:DNA-binding protein [Clostridia bacterium]
MAKNLSAGVLLDFYGELLTEKQQKALDLYYNEDLSLAEIAEEMQVSRQGVRAFIKDGEEHLYEFEKKLGMLRRFSDISRISKDMEAAISELPNGTDKIKLTKMIEEIKGRL